MSISICSFKNSNGPSPLITFFKKWWKGVRLCFAQLSFVEKKHIFPRPHFLPWLLLFCCRNVNTLGIYEDAFKKPQSSSQANPWFAKFELKYPEPWSEEGFAFSPPRNTLLENTDQCPRCVQCHVFPYSLWIRSWSVM